MKRTWIYAPILAISAFFAVRQIDSETAARKAFSARVKITRFDAQGRADSSGEMVRVFYFASNGKTMVESQFTAEEGTMPGVREVHDPIGRTIATADHQAKLTHKIAMRPERSALMTAPIARDCASAFPGMTCLGRQPEAVLGYPVELVEHRVADGRTVRRSWVARDLNWFAVKEEGSVDGNPASRTEATSILAGEPDPALFSTPANYRVVDSPARMLSGAAEARGSKAPGRDLLDALDRRHRR
jgi:hypothetical protein